jgi:hypothetical protein
MSTNIFMLNDSKVCTLLLSVAYYKELLFFRKFPLNVNTSIHLKALYLTLNVTVQDSKLKKYILHVFY